MASVIIIGIVKLRNSSYCCLPSKLMIMIIKPCCGDVKDKKI
jgi:hypothetical protein